MGSKPTAPEQMLPVATLSYPQLFVPKLAPGATKPKFSCVLVWQPDQKPLLDAAKQECAKLLLAQYGPGWMDAVKAGQLFWPWKPIAGLAVKPGYPEGGVMLNTNSQEDQPPHLYDRYQDPATGKARIITDPKKFYAGCSVIVLARPYLFENPMKKGVTMGLQAVQFHADGARLDGRSNPIERFAAEQEPAASIPSAATGTAQTPDTLEEMLSGAGNFSL